MTLAPILDPKIPFLADALDLPQVQSQLQTVMPDLPQVRAARVVRHKPGRRALIAYDLAGGTEALTVLGKIRAKGMDAASYQVQQALWDHGFNADSPDGLSVPEPLGMIPGWRMWLQRRVPGVPTPEPLSTAAGVPLARRIAALAHKLHCTPISTRKRHTLADELGILRDRLPQVSRLHPQWQPRIEWVLAQCESLAGRYPVALNLTTGIHRDFYSDQVLVEGDRLWLVDLDLFCQGHPALDIGNFIAHLIEQSLRQFHDPLALADREEALREAYVTRWLAAESGLGGSEDEWRWAIALYTELSLVRHIHISISIPERRPYTEAILTLCEQRLRAMAAV